MPESAAARLGGLTVLVARPAGQAEALCTLIEADGGRALPLPLFAIAALDAEAMAAAGAVLDDARAADLWLFTSRNAVDHAARLCPLPWPALAAVGDATAAALRQHSGQPVLTPPAGDGAAALLAHPALQQGNGRRALIVTGEQTLPVLEDGLRARGMTVTVLPVYRRAAIDHPPAAVAAWLQVADVAVIPSGEALRRLQALTPPEARSRLAGLQLAVPSPRVIETARLLGFTAEPLLPERVSDLAYLEVLRRHARHRHSNA
jgi:uroporphyrinogen-III synthase